ncbi:hypothetical protein M404DRAFT_994858 [Pisolithus tinctorius Marx 270]|uniref:Uncharacterized protein n=1 Tax=Pisolithus tinctorius Marx 270 TaxID=870435 RepID=A0A0C3PRH2_PISTI|nr:hypothetical protein M404DRAFT_994858 [Pisolithus tinctorius Marx 270]
MQPSEIRGHRDNHDAKLQIWQSLLCPSLRRAVQRNFFGQFSRVDNALQGRISPTCIKYVPHSDSMQDILAV